VLFKALSKHRKQKKSVRITVKEVFHFVFPRQIGVRVGKMQPSNTGIEIVHIKVERRKQICYVDENK
jgi:hypothetical protein